MRSSVAVLFALSIAAVAPSLAEAGARRWVRPVGNGGASKPVAGVKSDDAVQQVIRSTPAGGVAILPLGAFRAAVVIDRPMTLLAAREGTTFDATGLNLPAIEILPGVTDVTIDGLRLVGAGAEGLVARGGNDRLALRRLTVAASTGVGVRILSSADVVLERVSLEGNLGGGLDLVATRARLSGVSFRANGGTAAVLGGLDVELLDSAFEGGAEGIRFAGLRVRAFRAVMRNVATAARFAASSDTCALSRADVRGAASLAIADAGSVFATIEDNRCDATSSDAIRLAGSWHVVEGNVLAGAKGACVTGRGTSLRVADNDIANTTAEGVRLEGDGNTVEGNRIKSSGAANVAVVGAGCVVAMNECTKAGAAGVAVSGAQNIVMGNRATSSRREGLLVTGDANTLQNNQLVGTGLAGIRIAAGSANLVSTNSILRCGGRGFEDAGTGTVLDRNRID